MLTSTLLNVIAGLAAVTSASAAVIAERDVTPAGRSYTVLGCIDYVDDRYDPPGSPENVLVSIDECIAQPRNGATRLMSTMDTATNANQNGTCINYRNNGPQVSNLGNLPTTEDGWCATPNVGVTAIKHWSDLSYVGCYDKLWWYRKPYKNQWGSFKPGGGPLQIDYQFVPEEELLVTIDPGPQHPLFTCINKCQALQNDNTTFVITAQTPQGDCICTTADVAHDDPAPCTETSWRVYWDGSNGGTMPRAANNYA